MEADAPESTQWEVYCAQGRIVLEGWIPQQLYVEGVLSAEQAELIDALLDTVPTPLANRYGHGPHRGCLPIIGARSYILVFRFPPTISADVAIG